MNSSEESSKDIIADLQSRNMVVQLAGGDELKSHLETGSRAVYCGFDPTASSLHIGSMVPLLALKRFQMAGHKPIALVGGATGMIGDPSFKDSERKLNSTDIISDWVEQLKPQLSQFLDFDCGENSAVLVNNLDWTKDYDVLSFLRDVGKHFAVNAMIQKESVKQRLDREALRLHRADRWQRPVGEHYRWYRPHQAHESGAGIWRDPTPGHQIRRH